MARSNHRRLAEIEASLPPTPPDTSWMDEYTDKQIEMLNEFGRGIGLPLPPGVPASVILALANLTHECLHSESRDLQPVADEVARLKIEYR